ncbi:MAG: hypothetical protein ABIR11_04680 [Candidatus Limnocylindrales bacterium]
MASPTVPRPSHAGAGDHPGPVLAIVSDRAGATGRDVDVVLVLDTSWTADPGAEDADDPGMRTRIAGVRDVGERVLADRDLIAETSAPLDRWAAATGVIEALVIDTTSFWYYVRLRHWMWLQERILWALILDDVLRRERPGRVLAGTGIDEALADVLPLFAARDGFVLEAEPASATDGVTAARTTAAPSVSPTRLLARGMRRRVRGLLGRTPPPPRTPVDDRLDAVRARIDRLATEHGRLLVVRQHDPQLVETPDGPRMMNPYLDPIVDRLRGTALDPISLDMRGRVKRDADWARLEAPGNERELPLDALLLDGVALGDSTLDWEPPAVSIPVADIDLGPLLTANVIDSARDWLPRMVRSTGRIEGLLRRLRPAGIVLADEYHRQDWLTAAARVGIEVAAIQHGMIYPRHNGYMHADRPPSLHLADRTYVFGPWERDLLVECSVYRPDEVVVGGSARLDLVRDDPAGAAALRAELGIRPDERLVLLSGTWGRIYRRFHYPIALARVADRPLPGVHFVVKHHPGERDDGPYDAAIAGAAAAGGFAPPPITHVRAVDLYRMLAASDAHLGIHSTVLTEAVVTRTRNLLADQLYAADLLGYVEAGVATPVRDGGDLLRAIDPATPAPSEAASAAFVRRHFEPGAAADRIAGDLLAWLA